MAVLLSMQDPSSPFRDRTHAPCSGSAKSQPLDHQGIPYKVLLILPTTKEGTHICVLKGRKGNLIFFLLALKQLVPVIQILCEKELFLARLNFCFIKDFYRSS